MVIAWELRQIPIQRAEYSHDFAMRESCIPLAERWRTRNRSRDREKHNNILRSESCSGLELLAAMFFFCVMMDDQLNGTLSLKAFASILCLEYHRASHSCQLCFFDRHGVGFGSDWIQSVKWQWQNLRFWPVESQMCTSQVQCVLHSTWTCWQVRGSVFPPDCATQTYSTMQADLNWLLFLLICSAQVVPLRRP